MSFCSELFARPRRRRILASSGRLLLVPTFVLLVAAGAARAHHSFTATYFEDRTVTIEGTVLQFQFRNPHSFLHIEAADENGEMHTWSIEWGAGTQLNGQGITPTSLKAGDHVIVTGSPSRNPVDYRMRLFTLSRPSDGLSWGRNQGEVVN